MMPNDDLIINLYYKRRRTKAQIEADRIAEEERRARGEIPEKPKRKRRSKADNEVGRGAKRSATADDDSGFADGDFVEDDEEALAKVMASETPAGRKRGRRSEPTSEKKSSGRTGGSASKGRPRHVKKLRYSLGDEEGWSDNGEDDAAGAMMTGDEEGEHVPRARSSRVRTKRVTIVEDDDEEEELDNEEDEAFGQPQRKRSRTSAPVC